jgi:urea transport system ATP-binding protein
MPEPMLEIKGVTAGYGRSMVLFDVDVTIPRGGGAAIMGHNGAGKTTLLRVAVGLVPVKSGAVLLDGEDITKMAPNKRVRRGLGYVPQGQLCFPQMTTMENLQLVTTQQAAIDEVLDTFPVLTDLLSRPAGLLSGGQRQQLSIARTLLTKPRLLILDEPTEGIQPNVVAEIEQVIVDLTNRGDLTVLLVEQHVGFALRSTRQLLRDGVGPHHRQRRRRRRSPGGRTGGHGGVAVDVRRGPSGDRPEDRQGTSSGSRYAEAWRVNMVA